jgi:hypothetical protein
MRLDLRDRGGVGGVVRGDLDHAASLRQQEVVRRRGLIEAHDVRAALHHTGVVILGVLRCTGRSRYAEEQYQHQRRR